MKDDRAQIAEKQAQVLPGNNRHRRYSFFEYIERWMTPWTIVGNICGALIMACSFLWLNDNMDLYHSSGITHIITKALKATLPGAALEHMKYTSLGTIFALFMLGAAVFSATLVGRLMDTRPEAPEKNISWIRIGIGLGLWIFAGATVKELFLVFMPFTTSLDMILSSVMKYRN